MIVYTYWIIHLNLPVTAQGKITTVWLICSSWPVKKLLLLLLLYWPSWIITNQPWTHYPSVIINQPWTIGLADILLTIIKTDGASVSIVIHIQPLLSIIQVSGYQHLSTTMIMLGFVIQQWLLYSSLNINHHQPPKEGQCQPDSQRELLSGPKSSQHRKPPCTKCSRGRGPVADSQGWRGNRADGDGWGWLKEIAVPDVEDGWTVMVEMVEDGWRQLTAVLFALWGLATPLLLLLRGKM